MVGRKPKPINIHKLEKNKLYGDLAERERNTPSPQKKLTPRCPGRLTKEQRKEWRFYATILKNYGMFTIANAPILELIAVNMVQYKECLKKVQETGMLIKSPNGFPVYNPYWSAMNKIEGKILKCLNELGLSSTGLAKIGSLVTENQKKKSEMEALLD